MKDDTSAWDLLSLGLGIGASAAAVIAAIWGLWQLGKKWWDRSFGRRHAQARILDQLACTVSMEFAESLLGVPLLITHPYVDDREERTYRLPGAWVSIEPRGGAVHLFSITITDPKMFYNIDKLTFGILKLKLGKETFAQVDNNLHDGENQWLGARLAGYIRHYYLGNPGGYQQYWLSFNQVGAGAHPSIWGQYQSGIYGNQGASPPDPATITANTLTVSIGSVEEVKERLVFGPHNDQLRLLPGVLG
ncbi:ETEC_3214 domain-containing protein [Mycolicibacterium sp. 120270]|uniref:ETEC_3214 domain-containing protein n=1 Tax=Mycolicibacterium sp. 120270 TaxID=3090600 RepID=UPI00299D8017|nr:ETEC_3214 domain-containing protein [Mycolicibacterium sp. 120270]MDX1885824.1 hypothetical protein [Mycolicibacterium sp. 120270]